jgi:hypothetical protein
MQAIAIECSDTAYEHVMYFLKNLPKSEISKIQTYTNEPNETTKQAIDRLEKNDASVERFKDKNELFGALGL